MTLAILTGCTGVGPPAAPTPTLAPSAVPTATAAPTAAPTAVPTQAARLLPTADALQPGQYFLEFGGYRFTFTVADAGWSADLGAGGVFQGADSELAIFWPGGDIASLYRRACDWSGTEFEPGPSVDDLVEALALLEDFETTAPADVTVSGYTGKLVTLTVPMDVDFNACAGGNFQRDPGRHYQAVGQTDEIYVLDLDGERQMVVVSHTPGTSSEVSAQLAEILNSLEIAPI
jgi:hypothetical protein